MHNVLGLKVKQQQGTMLWKREEKKCQKISIQQ